MMHPTLTLGRLSGPVKGVGCFSYNLWRRKASRDARSRETRAMGKQLAAVPPPSAGLRAAVLRPFLSGMMRVHGSFDRLANGKAARKEHSAFQAMEPDAEHGPILDA